MIALRHIARAQTPMTLQATAITSYAITLRYTGDITVDWGDGTSTTISSADPNVDRNFSRTYGSAYTGNITISGALVNVNWLKTTATANVICEQEQLVKLVNLEHFEATGGSQNWRHDIGQLPAGLTYYVNSGSNTTSGDIGQLPTGLTYYYNQGGNTTSGDIGQLPSGLTTYTNGGSNTTSGDIGQLPAGLTYYTNAGSNTVADYTSGKTWPNNMQRVYMRQATGYGLSSTEVDNLLIDLANVATWTADKQIDLRGVNAARTAASDAAVTTLTGKGVTVLTN